MRPDLVTRARRAYLAIALMSAAGLCAPARTQADLDPAPADLDATEIAKTAQATLRSDRTFVQATMTIVSPRLSEAREVAFRSWDDALGKRSLVRILAPPKDAEMAFVKLNTNLWIYIPRIRTVRVPPSMMLERWMGSDFTNDDLVRQSSEIGDYDHHLLGIDRSPEGGESKEAYVVEYVPHDEAAVVWNRIVGWIDKVSYAPIRREYYGENGTMLRVLRYSDIRVTQGRSFPYRWTMTPVDKPGQETTVLIDEIRFDEPIDEAIFTTNTNTLRGRQ